MAIPIGSRDVFQYEELPDSGTYFRLLRVMSAVQKEPTENGPPINIDSSVAECELTVWPLEDSPPYHAVSYTWGDSAKTRWIEVNGRPIQVRWNCAYVLWQAHRRSGKDDYIWVDAICINQTDTREKSHQVAEMGKIFANAKCVLACIGPHDKFSRSFFPDLNRHSELLARASAVRNEFPDINSNNKKRFKSATKQIFRARYHSSEPWEPGELMAQFSPIISRPYFQRVWTLPELWLARRAEILCGEDCTPAELMHGLNSLMDWDMPRYRVPKWFKALPLLRRAVALFLRPPGYSPFLIPSGHVMAMAHRPGQKMEPINSISIAASLECQDLRDRVYALLSIVDWVPLEGKQIRPDYERDLFDLVLDMLQRTGGDASTRYRVVPMVFVGLFRHRRLTPRLAQALFDRRHVNTVKSAAWMAVEDVPHTSRCERIFIGVQLRVNNDRWEIIFPGNKHRDRFSHPFRHTMKFKAYREVLNALKQPYHLVTCDENQPLALLPPCTQSGDWVVNDGNGKHLIIRERADGRYKIVGEARVSYYIGDYILGGGQRFKISFDIEDALIFYWNQRSSDNGFDDIHELGLIVSSLENAVCYTEGSSYAEMEVGNEIGYASD